MLKIIKTLDGSNTLFSEKYGQYYHNVNGAITEALHIYINLGLNYFKNQKIRILEIGYGTGLNAILSYKRNAELNNEIFYHGLDNNIISFEIYSSLYNNDILSNESLSKNFYFNKTENVKIANNFLLFKENIDLKNFTPRYNYDLIYYDAFSPQVQPEMWSEENLIKILKVLKQNGIFVTYCVQGKIKDILRQNGMDVKRFCGPPGKRHVLRATKI